MKQKEAEWSKDKALLEQKNQQLELQLKDSQMRCEQQKQMHEQVIKCLGAP